MGSAQRLVDQHQTLVRTLDRERQRTRLTRVQVGERSHVAMGLGYLDPAARNRCGQLRCAGKASTGQHFVADGRRHRDASKLAIVAPEP